MKRLISPATLTLAIPFGIASLYASIAPAAWATGVRGDSKFTHFVESAAYPDNARAPLATHEIELHVVGRALSQLSIDLPEGINVKNGIEITDKSGKKIDATASINGKKATVAFTQPVPPETILLISLKGITNSDFQGRTWLYRVYTQKVGMPAEIPLGPAYITTYGD